MTEEKLKGTLFVHSDPPHVVEIDLPINTHAVVMMWAMDMLRAIQQQSKFRRWLLRMVLGRYAYREMVGLRDAIDAEGYDTHFEYSLEDMDYHQDKVRL